MKWMLGHCETIAGGNSMRGRLILALMGIVLIAGSSVGAQQNGKPLTNQDVISMVKNLLPESVILSAIKTNDTDFDVSANGLISLKKAGVTAKVMEAMLAAANNKKNSGSAPATPDATGQAPNGAAFASGGAGAPAAAPAGAAPAWHPTVSSRQGSTILNLVEIGRAHV